VVDQINDTIRRITPAGEVTTIAGYPFSAGTNDGVGSIARFGNIFGGRPTGIAVDNATNVYVADTPNCTIRKLAFDGMNWVVSTFAGSATHPGTNDGAASVARFTSPAGMTTDSAGNIYVLDGFAVRRVTPAGTVTTLAGSVTTSGTTDGTNSVARFGFGTSAPKGVAVDGNTNIYVADTYNYSIRQVSPVGADWVVTTFAGVTGFLGYGFNDGTNADARFANPYGIAVDKNGIIYVTDSPAQTIRKIVVNGTDHIVTTFAGLYPCLEAMTVLEARRGS
jgi:NHL repeat